MNKNLQPTIFQTAF